MPSPGGQFPGCQPQKLLRLGWVSGVWHPIDLPEGYHTASQGQSQTTYAPVPCPRDPVWSGCARSTGRHTDPSVQDRLLGSSPGRRMSRSKEKLGEVTRALTELYRHTAAPLTMRTRLKIEGSLGGFELVAPEWCSCRCDVSAYIGTKVGPLLQGMALAAPNAPAWAMSTLVSCGTSVVFGHPTAARVRFASWNAADTVAEIRPRSETV